MKEVKIDTLVPDDKNFNQGTQYGQHLIEESLRKFGAGRSVLLDKNNRIIAGNKTIENAAAIGMDNVIVVETTGDKVVAVKRTDIDLDTKEGREMALADNATSAVNLRWDEDALKQAEKEFGIAPSEWGVELESFANFDDKDHTGTETSRLSDLKFTDCYYMPTEKPEITLKDCINLDLYNKKMQVIEESNLTDEMKAVMQLLTYRFIKIDFENVANYYAFNASEEEKRIIERLRCVLVDGSIEGFIEDHMLRVNEYFN